MHLRQLSIQLLGLPLKFLQRHGVLPLKWQVEIFVEQLVEILFAIYCLLHDLQDVCRIVVLKALGDCIYFVFAKVPTCKREALLDEKLSPV